MRTCHWVLIGCAIALVLTVGVPSLASATVLFCGSGDVFCLIGSIKSANEGGGPGSTPLRLPITRSTPKLPRR